MPNFQEVFGQIDDMADEIVRLHQELVRIPSVNTGAMPTGDETPGLRVRSGLARGGRHRVGDSGTDAGAGEHHSAHRGRCAGGAAYVHVTHRRRSGGGGGGQVDVPAVQRDDS